ncbi:MAG: PspA/IM30 family protein [Acidobacteria bacterium]|nr:PspA/IM30 family protein [Acidobacteriota bacterium]
MENPELVLQQTIRDMRDRVPELNNSVAQVMATERLLGKQKENLETQVVDLDSKIKASVKMNRDDIATAYIGQLQQAQMDLERTNVQYDNAQSASKQALKARDNYVLNMKKRTAEAMQLISAAKQAKLRNSWRKRWKRSTSATMPRLSTKCARRSIAASQPRKPSFSSERVQWTHRCRISSARRWTFSCRTNCSSTNLKWDSFTPGRLRPANRSPPERLRSAKKRFSTRRSSTKRTR